MVDTASAGGSREQTLLEAAKAFIGNDWGSQHLRNLRAAIVREEAKPVSDYDRAQTAEAAARWHRDESERLSIALAALREEHAKWHEQNNSGGYAKAIRQELGATPMIGTLDAAKALRERAEKAEADAGTLRNQLTLAVERSERLSEKLKAFSSPSDSRPSPEAPSPSDGMRGSREHRAGCVPSEPKVGIVRDPVTGWTFDTMRQQFDAARTTVRVLAAELVAARQQIAGTKGFEAKEVG